MFSELHFAVLQPRLELASTANITCARPQKNDIGDPVFGGSSMTLHTLMIFIAAPCLGLTVLSSVFLSYRHLHHYTAPQEQRQILRIINLPAVYAIFNFLSLVFYLDYYYIQPIADVYYAFTVAALFFLVLEWSCPDGTDREKYFEGLPAEDKKGKPLPGSSLPWYQHTYGMALQYPLTKIVFATIMIVTQYYGVYCENSFSPKYAHLWLFVIDLLFVGGALTSVTNFAKRMGKERRISLEHKPRAKIWTFIGFLIFQLLQSLIFGIMNGKLFSPNKKATYNDINFGIPSLLTCFEAMIFSFIYFWSYSAAEYNENRRMDRLGGHATRTKTLKAMLNALNLSDIIVGTVTAFPLLFMELMGKLQGRGRASGSRGMVKQQQVGLEPLSDRTRMRGYSGGEEFDTEYSPPLETEYDGNSYVPPTMPRNVRDPSPADRARTFRADGLRPQMGGSEYQPLTRSRDPSPNGTGQQYPRDMV